MTITTTIATAREVSAAIASLGYQASAETLGAISRNCRDEFLGHLSRCVTGQDADGASLKVIDNLLRALSPDSMTKLKAIIPEVTVDMVVPIVRTVPAKLLSAIAAASDATHANHAAAAAYLRSVFASPPAAPDSSQQAPEQRAERPARNNPPAERDGAAPQAPRSQPAQPPANQKEYKSVHVYGGSYALCFNAGEWDGKPGIMVDAAAAEGPKSYDWQNATHIWLNVNEIGAVLAVFRRWRKGVEFNAHGAQNDKSFSIEFQGQHFYTKVAAKKASSHPVRGVKILPTDATAVSVLFLHQLVAAYPAIPVAELMATVRATHQIDNAAAA